MKFESYGEKEITNAPKTKKVPNGVLFAALSGVFDVGEFRAPLNIAEKTHRWGLYRAKAATDTIRDEKHVLSGNRFAVLGIRLLCIIFLTME